MSTSDIFFLGYFVAGFTLFAVVLSGTALYERVNSGKGR